MLVKQIREALTEARKEAAEKWQAFETLREDAKKEGVDLVKDNDAFQRLEGSHKEYATAAHAAAELEGKLMAAIDMDGDGGPKGRQALDREKSGGDGGSKIWTPGQRLVDSDAYKTLLSSGELTRKSAGPGDFRWKAGEITSREEFKALITGLSDTSAGALVTPDRRAGLIDLLLRPIVVRDLVTVGDTDSDLVEWVRETTFTNAAAETAEATAVSGASGTKPESALAWEVIQQNVKTIAHWIPATKRALSDVGQLRTLIDQRLQDGVALRLDSQMIAGDGTGENIRGILNTTGVLSQDGTGMPSVEALLRGIVKIRLAFMEPNAVLMHPNDFLDMRLATNANGDYIYGPPNLPGPSQAWGLPIIQSTVISEGTALVGKWDEAILWVREGVSVSASDSHADFFIRNMVAVLAEGRFAFGVPRPAAFAQVTNI